MINDLKNQIASLSSSMQTPPGKQHGGYAGSGIYRLGERGYEFVLSHSTTKAAERAARGMLTQENMMKLLLGKNVVYNDHRRFDSKIREEDRWALRLDTMRMVEEMVRL
jgi:hypothetical protein